MTIAPHLRPPTGIAALHAENAATRAEGKHLGAVPAASGPRVAMRELCYS